MIEFLKFLSKFAPNMNLRGFTNRTNLEVQNLEKLWGTFLRTSSENPFRDCAVNSRIGDLNQKHPKKISNNDSLHFCSSLIAISLSQFVYLCWYRSALRELV